MDLTPEQIEVGKDNYNKAVGQSRREFLTGVAAGGAGIGAAYFGYKKLQGKPVRFGFIGTGDEGSILLTQHPPAYMDVVAVADIRPTNRVRALHGDGNEHRVGLIEKLGPEAAAKVKVYKDHKELLADPNVEAVVIAVPLNQHAPLTIEALNAGKHVLCEKLMAKTVAECKAMIAAARKNDRLLAVGHQRHYGVLYENANHLVEQGLLGDIKHIRAQWHRNNSFPGRDQWLKKIPGEDTAALKDTIKNYGYDSLETLVNWRLYKEDTPWSSGGPDQRLQVVVSGKEGGPALDTYETGGARAASAPGTTETVSRGYTEEMEHLCHCIREYEGSYYPDGKEIPREKGGLRCNGVVAMADAIMALTANLAMKHRVRIPFQPAWFDPESPATPEEDVKKMVGSLAGLDMGRLLRTS